MQTHRWPTAPGAVNREGIDDMDWPLEPHKPLILAHERARLDAVNLLRSQLKAQLVVSQCLLTDCQELLLQGMTREALERLQSASDVVGRCIEQLGSMASHPCPYAVHSSLPSALRCLAKLYRSLFDTDLEIDGSLAVAEMSTSPVLRNDVRLALYRIAAEALLNVARHANASSVNVHLGFFSGGDIYLIVADNGRGFDPDDFPQSSGLRSMERDAESLGGKLEVDSTPGWGAMVTVCLPCLHTQPSSSSVALPPAA